ncbi:hypothetical protein FA213_09270 [Pseudomonas aeruginosa]|nr:hypothetical protein [Pseudomonas aeruginosa]MCO3243255.1 hypothetical protein [Pseudomonas aeruginosa]
MPGQWRNCRPMSLIWVMAAMDAGSRSTDLAFLLGNVLARFAAELPKPLRCGLGRRGTREGGGVAPMSGVRSGGPTLRSWQRQRRALAQRLSPQALLAAR